MKKLLVLAALGLSVVTLASLIDRPRVVSAAPRPLVCPTGAYRHAAPPFCVALPSGLAGTKPYVLPLSTAMDGGIQFAADGQVISVWWVRATNRTVVRQWLTPPARGASRVGDFQVLRSDRAAGRTNTLVYDATQHAMNDIYLVPSVRASTVVEGRTWVVRCQAVVNLAHRQRPADVVKAHAAFLDACRTLQVGG